MKPDNTFRDRVYVIVSQIPKGRVMTYGQIAALCGSPRSARVVGGVAHWGDQSLPWQRVVKKDGSLAEGFPGGTEGHAQVLRQEGIAVDEQYRINIRQLQWHPK